MTSCIVDVGNELVPEGRRASTLGPSGIGEREDTVGNDASELGCEGRGTEFVVPEPGVAGFVDS